MRITWAAFASGCRAVRRDHPHTAGGRGWTCIHQFLGLGIDSKVQALQGSRAEQGQIAGLGKHNLVDGPDTRDIKARGSNPALENLAVGLPKLHGLSALDAKRLQDRSWNPGGLGAGIDESPTHEFSVTSL